MKVAMLSAEYGSATSAGGIATYLQHLARGLVEAGHVVTVVTRSATVDQTEIEQGVEIIRLHRPDLDSVGRRWRTAQNLNTAFGWEWRAARKLRSIIRNGYEVLEAPAWAGQAAFYSRTWAVPLVLRLMTPYVAATLGTGANPLRTFIRTRMERRALDRAVLYLALSNSVARTYEKLHRIQQSRIRLAPVGIPVPPSQAVASDPNLILFLGRLEPRKGLDLLIEAMPAVWSQVPTARLVVLGQDQPFAPGRKFYRDWANDIYPPEMHGNVRFLDRVTDAERDRYLSSCRLLVAPSRFESFGLIYVEAMSHAKPVIGTRNGGAEEIIQDGINGYICDLDSWSLATAIVRIMKDDVLAARLGRDGLRLFHERFTVPEMVRSTVSCYEEATSIWKQLKQGLRGGG